ncbi:MAG TPA: hypothetical protein VEI07_02120 [Planctomycetaceae bacterium]|nr:hypothetical protein [Planctomycetaceae bacterium]
MRSTRCTPGDSLIEIPSGKLVGFVSTPASSLAPAAHISSVETANTFGFCLYRVSDNNPLITLGIDSECSPRSTFNLDGSRLAWGNRDGTVTVCYLAEVQRPWPRSGSVGEPRTAHDGG